MMLYAWKQIEPLVKYGGLFIALIFLAVTGVPLVNYIAQVGAMFAFTFFAFRQMHFFLAVSIIGSMAFGILLLGFAPVLIVAWAMVVFPAVILGRLMQVGTSPSKSFILAMLTAAAISVILYFSQRELIDMTMTELNDTIGVFVANLGLNEVARANLTDSMTGMVEIIRRLLPSLMALSAITQLFLGWAIMAVLLRGTGEFVPNLGHFVYWKMPYYYIYLFGLFILLRLAGPDLVKIIADNILVFLGFFYAVFGFSVIDYFLKKIRLSLFLRILFYIGFAFLQLPGLAIAALIGLLDSNFDFRRVRARIIG